MPHGQFHLHLKGVKKNSEADGFFVVACAVLFNTHLTIANLDGLWTTRNDGLPLNQDIMLALTTEGLREILVIKSDHRDISTLCPVLPGGW